MPDVVQWEPSKTEGVSGVRLASVYTDRLELTTDTGIETYLFADIAEKPDVGFLGRMLSFFGRTQPPAMVAERDWFHPPEDRFFRFFSEPQVTVYCATESEDVPYSETLFRRIQDVIRRGGYGTYDLG